MGSAHRSWTGRGCGWRLLIAGTAHWPLPFFLLLITPALVTQHSAGAASLPLPDKPSIVVLPFVNMSDDPEARLLQRRHHRGHHHGPLQHLQPLRHRPQLRLHLQGQSGEGPRRKSGDGRAVCAGRQRTQGGRQVRITAQLIDATTGGHLWSERYDRPLQDIFALQDEIVQKIVPR